MLFELFWIACVGLGVGFGAWRGFSWQIAGIVSVMLGFLGGRLTAAQTLSTQLDEQTSVTTFLVFAVTYVLISVVVYLVAHLLRRRIKREERLKRYDKQAGALLGAIHGLAICSVLTMFAVVVVPGLRDPILSRTSGRLFARPVGTLQGILPDHVNNVIDPYLHPEKAEGKE